jgi:catalase-peroxidase
MLRLTIPEMTVLLGGMRSMGIHFDNANTGILTSTPGQLNNAFFTNLLDMKYTWKKDENQDVYFGTNRESDDVEWSATRADLIFGSNSELRAVAEVYASNDAEEKFVTDFINAWFKVMMLDRFDVRD